MKRTSKRSKELLWALLVLLLTFALAGTSVAQDGSLVSWWRAEGDADDAAGGNDGMLRNGATFAPGMVGEAFSLDGVDDFVEVADNANLRPAEFTVAAWINTTTIYAPFSPAFIVARSGPTGNNGYELSVNYTTGVARVDVNLNPSTFATAKGTTNVADGNWHHVAGTYDGSTLNVYVDCVLEGSTAYAAGIGYVPGDRLHIGKRLIGVSPHFSGRIDEVRFYNRALSDEEICTATTTDVEIDVKPGSGPNNINPKSKGKIPVVILTTDIFDANTIDAATVFFGATGTEAAPVHFAVEDVDGDGDVDVILHFQTQDTGILCGATSASLTGETFSGNAFEGIDSINTVGCN